MATHTPDPEKGKAPIFKEACEVLLERAKVEIKRPRTLSALESSLNCVKDLFLGSMRMDRIVVHHVKDHPTFIFHGLRHAWATELVKAGIDFGTIAQWAGHNDGGLLIAKRYGRHMRRDHMQMAAQKATFSLAERG